MSMANKTHPGPVLRLISIYRQRLHCVNSAAHIFLFYVHSKNITMRLPIQISSVKRDVAIKSRQEANDQLLLSLMVRGGGLFVWPSIIRVHESGLVGMYFV